ncbi:hypothetical protein [Desulfobacula sp.]|uniref:hypothetical protein n=1 Tax=Desulfobacula sp. TaxID=2593537 RepID=UPI002622D8A8|nr:hypothetical protein [Desulfobacula sp.]
MALTTNNNLSRQSLLATNVDSRTLKMALRDTSELQKKIDLSKYVDAEKINPTRLVVVDQFPRAGEQVPLGTPVILTFMSKDSIPVGDIAALSDAIKGKYKTADVKVITDDIQSDVEMKKVLAENKAYTDMSATQKDTVKKYAVEKEIVASNATDETLAAVHKDLTFIYNI